MFGGNDSLIYAALADSLIVTVAVSTWLFMLCNDHLVPEISFIENYSNPQLVHCSLLCVLSISE